jgi:branched-chain amino acid transport system substrate-binding protein
MATMSRRKFLQLSILAGGGLITSDWLAQVGTSHCSGRAFAAEPIKIGIIDPLTGPYKTSSIHDVHGATVAMDAFNKRGGVLGRPVTLIEADDASNVETAVKVAQKLIGQDRVDVLMGTFNGEVALAVSELAMREDKLFMVTGAHITELTGARCNARTFVFMPNARMMAQAVAPSLAKTYGKRWYMITADTVDGRSALQAMTGALTQQGGEVIGSSTTAFGASDFSNVMMEARQAKPDAVILNLYGWDLVNALKSYAKLDLAKEKIGVGGMIAGEQIGRPLGYANNAGIWGLIWDPKVNTESSRRFIQGVIDKYQHTPTSRCYLGYAAMTQVLEAIERAGTTDTAALVKALEGHEFDGLKEGKSYFRSTDHQHVQDVLVGEAYGKELGLGHYKIIATVKSDPAAQAAGEQSCRLAGAR